MKPWMKVLVWLGLGGGIGFFAGYKSGYSKCAQETCEYLDQVQERLDGYSEKVDELARMQAETLPANQIAAVSQRMKDDHLIPEEMHEKIRNALMDYGQGGFAQDNGDIPATNPIMDDYLVNADNAHQAEIDQVFNQPATDEEPEMPEEVPEIPDILGEDVDGDSVVVLPPEEPVIPQLHPEDMVPHPITEEEFNLNVKDYDISCLAYYADEDVIYDPEYDDVMPNPEGLLGHGWFAAFSPTQKVIYIENDTMETLYKIEYKQGSIHDA